MAKLKIKLNRPLRRSFLRGHPWAYRDSIVAPTGVTQAQLCQVFDNQGELGWGIYDPHSQLSLRMITTGSAPPNATAFMKRFRKALDLRSSIRREETNAFRLWNGEGDELPGLSCDLYGQVAVVQFDGQGPSEFWNRDLITSWLLENTDCLSVIEKSRRSSERSMHLLGGEPCPSEVVISENTVKFKVNLEKGQKTGFFLDQRENRQYVRQGNAGKSLLNLFSYTGGFSVYAGLGGAARVASLDIAKGAIETAAENWALNGLDPDRHQGLAVDVFEYLNGEKEKWDHIVVDPPSMGHSEQDKETARQKYIEVFAAAARRVVGGGDLSLSSCSSHISFQDFFEIINESLSGARRRGRILRVSGQGPDHPFPHICPEMRYLKFVHLSLD